MKCQIQVLPPGFTGRLHRSTASSIAFVIQGEGRTMFADKEVDWGKHDTVAIPNWSWHRHVNPGRRDPAYLFTMTDSPILSPRSASTGRKPKTAPKRCRPRMPAAKLTAAE